MMKSMFGLKSSDIELITKTFASYPEVQEAIIYGSRAMGNFKHGSDVDLALKGEVDENLALTISIVLNERLPLPYKFDVLAYTSLDHAALKADIDQYGKSIYRKE